MQLFDLEESNLLAIKLMEFIHAKLAPVFDTLFSFRDDIRSSFQRENWTMALDKIKRRGSAHYEPLQADEELRFLYKSSFSFYVRNVLKAREVNSIPKINHFMNTFVGVVVSNSHVMQTPAYFSEYKYADRLEFIKSSLRQTLSYTMKRERQQHPKTTTKKQPSIHAGFKLPAPPQSRKPNESHSKRTTQSRVSKTSNSIRPSRQASVAASIGPDDSISVAPFSKLQPKIEMKIPSMRVNDEPTKAAENPASQNEHVSDIKIISLTN